MINEQIFEAAYAMAQQAFEKDEIPVGAVVFHPETQEIIAAAHNLTETNQDPTAHAEILAIKEACQKLGVKRLDGYALFVTLEPCVMCAGAISWARIATLYYGASDIKTGGLNQGACVFTHPQTHHKPEIIGGIEAEKCGALMTLFFQRKRQLKRK